MITVVAVVAAVAIEFSSEQKTEAFVRWIRTIVWPNGELLQVHVCVDVCVCVCVCVCLKLICEWDCEWVCRECRCLRSWKWL